MKNKKLIYILLPAVLIVWGSIVYKVLWYRQRSDVGKSSEFSLLLPEDSTRIDSSEIHLQLKYRDPFLEGYRSFYPYSTAVTPEIIGENGRNLNQQKNAESEVIWPEILYSGMVRNSKSKKNIALLRINGKNYLLAPEETCKGLKVGKIMPDSVELHFKAKTRIFKKSK